MLTYFADEAIQNDFRRKIVQIDQSRVIARSVSMQNMYDDVDYSLLYYFSHSTSKTNMSNFNCDLRDALCKQDGKPWQA